LQPLLSIPANRHLNGYPWLNVLYAGGRYGFNAEEERWAKGDAPEYESFFIEKMRAMAGD